MLNVMVKRFFGFFLYQIDRRWPVIVTLATLFLLVDINSAPRRRADALTINSNLTMNGTTTITASQYLDAQNTAYLLDPANTGNSLLVAGSVGIGTTSPGQKLTVAGTVESTSGGFKFPDGTTQTTKGATSLTCTFVDNTTYAGYLTGDQVCSNAGAGQCVAYNSSSPGTAANMNYRCDANKGWCSDGSPQCLARCCKVQ